MLTHITATHEQAKTHVEILFNGMNMTVWCGFTLSFITDPFLFEELQGDTSQTVSVTGERYEALLKINVIPYLQER